MRKGAAGQGRPHAKGRLSADGGRSCKDRLEDGRGLVGAAHGSATLSRGLHALYLGRLLGRTWT